jgi:hypothetical protein
MSFKSLQAPVVDNSRVNIDYKTDLHDLKKDIQEWPCLAQ